MEISVELSIVELYGHRMVSILINSPHKSYQIKTCKTSVSMIRHVDFTDIDIFDFLAKVYFQAERERVPSAANSGTSLFVCFHVYQEHRNEYCLVCRTHLHCLSSLHRHRLLQNRLHPPSNRGPIYHRESLACLAVSHECRRRL